MLESLDAEFRAELGRLDDLFDRALHSGDSHKVDHILRSLDFQPSASDHSDSADLRSNICDGCTAKLRNLIDRLRRDEAAAKAEAEKRRMAELERQLECQQVWSPGFRTALIHSARPACT